MAEKIEDQIERAMRTAQGAQQRADAAHMRATNAFTRADQAARRATNTLILSIVVMIVAVVVLLINIATARAFDNGQYDNADPKIRSWFKNVRSPHGIPCCDISDGHPTDWHYVEDGYESFFEGKWHRVPPEAVVRDAANPTGRAVTWYVQQGAGVYYIRCFVPGPDA